MCVRNVVFRNVHFMRVSTIGKDFFPDKYLQNTSRFHKKCIFYWPIFSKINENLDENDLYLFGHILETIHDDGKNEPISELREVWLSF